VWTTEDQTVAAGHGVDVDPARWQAGLDGLLGRVARWFPRVEPRRRARAFLATGRLLVEVAALLEEADFYRPAHRTTWRAILRLADRGEPTDPVTVLGELDQTGELAEVGGGPSCTP
jgi:DnaB-like helicase N terminal domain